MATLGSNTVAHVCKWTDWSSWFIVETRGVVGRPFWEALLSCVGTDHVYLEQRTDSSLFRQVFYVYISPLWWTHLLTCLLFRLSFYLSSFLHFYLCLGVSLSSFLSVRGSACPFLSLFSFWFPLCHCDCPSPCASVCLSLCPLDHLSITFCVILPHQTLIPLLSFLLFLPVSPHPVLPGASFPPPGPAWGPRP